MVTFTDLQRRILAVLEEAGEEDLSALTNTVAKPQGDVREIRAMAEALTGLLNADCVTIAQTRDDTLYRWIPLNSAAATAVLRNLGDHFEWSASQVLWQWKTDYPRIVVMLTESGLPTARRILTESDWPTQPLESYD